MNMNFLFLRKAILLIHGFAGGPWDYDNLSNDLQLYIDFDVYSFTLPGHDKMIISKVTKDDWINEAEHQVESLIEKGYKTIYVVGHSMGGVIACHLARKYNQVKKLVLAAPAFRYFVFKDDKLDVIDSLKQMTSLFKDYKPNVVLSRIFKIPVSTAGQFMKLVDEHHSDPKDITCPVLIIQGLNDKVVPLESSSYVYKNVKSDIKLLYKVKNVTHDVFRGERGSEINKLVIDFFRSKNYLPRQEIKNI